MKRKGNRRSNKRLLVDLCNKAGEDDVVLAGKVIYIEKGGIELGR